MGRVGPRPAGRRGTGHEAVRSWIELDTSIVTWARTRVEIAGANECRAHEGLLTRQQRRDALGRFEALEPDYSAVPFVCLDERLATAAEREGLIVLSA